tara:strand:+ start:158 stop:895 length:738 start_codon:yes stop_codon:yes gene_type:complete
MTEAVKNLTPEQYNNLITNRPNLFSYLDVTKPPQAETYTYTFLENVKILQRINNDINSDAIQGPNVEIKTKTNNFENVFDEVEQYDTAVFGNPRENRPLTGSNVVSQSEYSNEALSKSTNIHFDLHKPYTVLNDIQIEVFIGQTSQNTQNLPLPKNSQITFTYLPNAPDLESSVFKFSYNSIEYESPFNELKKSEHQLKQINTGGGKRRTKRRIPPGLISSKKRRRNSRKIQKNKSNLNFSTKKK